MVSFPNCKINLGLHVVAKRNDGYHDLETVFYPLPLFDALEIIENNFNEDSLTLTGRVIEGEIDENLCLRAVRLLRKDFPSLPFLKIHLHKVIPSGAGLGGGSADAAFTLILANKKFNLGISKEQLTSYAEKLGSDCPFFILNSPAIGKGRGEKLQEIQLSLKGFYLCVVNPGIHISTADAFKMIAPSAPAKGVSDIISLPIEQWRSYLSNDFENPVFAKHTGIASLKESMYEKGALYASMSGSGSSVYGIFREKPVMDFKYPDAWLLQL